MPRHKRAFISRGGGGTGSGLPWWQGWEWAAPSCLAHLGALPSCHLLLPWEHRWGLGSWVSPQGKSTRGSLWGPPAQHPVPRGHGGLHTTPEVATVSGPWGRASALCGLLPPVCGGGKGEDLVGFNTRDWACQRLQASVMVIETVLYKIRGLNRAEEKPPAPPRPSRGLSV